MGYSIYSLVYDTHRGWYSFVISTLTSFVYMFGFVRLLNQTLRLESLTKFFCSGPASSAVDHQLQAKGTEAR